MKEKEYKLCYINENKAYFTDSFEKQWGDDWDNAPYEYNAGEPYSAYYEDKKRYKIDIKELYFELPSYWDYLPYERGHCYSVEQINKGATAWLEAADLSIKAGTSLEEFKKVVKEHNGKIYALIEKDETEEIKELKKSDCYVDQIFDNRDKINELVRAVNKLNKQDTAKETQCMTD